MEKVWVTNPEAWILTPTYVFKTSLQTLPRRPAPFSSILGLPKDKNQRVFCVDTHLYKDSHDCIWWRKNSSNCGCLFPYSFWQNTWLHINTHMLPVLVELWHLQTHLEKTASVRQLHDNFLFQSSSLWLSSVSGHKMPIKALSDKLKIVIKECSPMHFEERHGSLWVGS